MNVIDFGKVIDVLEDMCDRRILDKYAIGGAFAATLHDEPIATIDLDIFFVFSRPQNTEIRYSVFPKYMTMRASGDFLSTTSL